MQPDVQRNHPPRPYDSSKFPKLTAETLNEEGCINLISAIIGQASKDYKYAVKCITNKPELSAYLMKQKVEDFFRSAYFSNLSLGIDGEAIIQTLEKECGIHDLDDIRKKRYDCKYWINKLKEENIYSVYDSRRRRYTDKKKED